MTTLASGNRTGKTHDRHTARANARADRERLLQCLRELAQDSTVTDFSQTYAAIQRALVNGSGTRDYELEAAFTDLRFAVVTRLVQTLSTTQPMAQPTSAALRRIG